MKNYKSSDEFKLNRKKISVLVGLCAVLILSTTVSGCKSKDDNRDAAVANTTEAATEAQAEVTVAPEQEATETANANGMAWPKEFTDWLVPTIEAATITFADNKSVDGNTITQGVNVVVNLKELKKNDFDSYLKELEANDFIRSADSIADIMMFYTKAVAGGEIKITLTYSDESTTIMVNNSAAAADKANAKATGSGATGTWPEVAKDVPEFKAGKFVETVDLTGGFYAVTYTGVTQNDLDQYRKKLLEAGFTSQENEDTEGYARIDGKSAYSVGFVIEGDQLQLMIVCAQQ